MKLLILAPASNVHTLRWCNAFDDLGIKVYLASQHKKISGYNSGVEYIELPIRNSLGYYFNIFFLKRKMVNLNIDIVNVHYASGYGTLGRLLGFSKTVLTTWGSDILIYPKIKKLNKKILIKNLNSATRITAASKMLASETKLYVNKDIDLVPFGVVLENFENKSRNFLNKINSNEKIYIGTVKALEDIYGIDVLIKAFKFLVNDLLDSEKSLKDRLYLKIVGDGSKEVEYKLLAKRLGIEEKVIFMPKVQHIEVQEVLSSLDIFVALSRSESFGVSVVEAGINKLPIVVTAVGGFKELIRNEKNGILIENENYQDAAKAILFLLKNPNLAKQYGESAFFEFSDNFNWDDNVDTMLGIFSDLHGEYQG